MPVDQILIAPGDPVADLCLPPGGTSVFRCNSESQDTNGPMQVTAPARD